MTKFTTPKAFDLPNVFLFLSLLLLPLGCEGYILILLLGLRPTAATFVKFTLDQVSPHLFLLKSGPHSFLVWKFLPAQDALEK